MKPGWKTSEFWVTVLTDAGFVATSLAGALPAKWAAALTAAASLTYAVSRGLAKQGGSGGTG